MTQEQRTKLFEYFHNEHNIMLLESDLDEVSHIVCPEEYPQTVYSKEMKDEFEIPEDIKEFLKRDWELQKAEVLEQYIQYIKHKGIMLNTNEMLAALTQSENHNCRDLARKILSGEKTIENELKYTGSFMTAVLKGDYAEAIALSDSLNRAALVEYQSVL